MICILRKNYFEIILAINVLSLSKEMIDVKRKNVRDYHLFFTKTKKRRFY